MMSHEYLTMFVDGSHEPLRHYYKSEVTGHISSSSTYKGDFDNIQPNIIAEQLLKWTFNNSTRHEDGHYESVAESARAWLFYEKMGTPNKIEEVFVRGRKTLLHYNEDKYYYSQTQGFVKLVDESYKIYSTMFNGVSDE